MEGTAGRTGSSHSVEGLELPADEMRRLGYRVVDLLVDRWKALDDEPAWVGGGRDELEALLREDPPEGGRPAEEVIDRALREILPRAGRVDHPRFFAFVPSSPTWPGVLGDLLASGYNVFQGTWLESAGPSQVELVVLDWFRQWTGLPAGSGGLLTSGGSAANLAAVVAARERTGAAEGGVLYVGDQGHSSLVRAARIAGFPPSRIRVVPSDPLFRMDPDGVAEAIRRDRERGLRPVAVCASAGATNTGAVDPLPALASVARAHGAWFHVDAAYGGFAVLTEEGRRALNGIAEADSLTLDPHKWLFQPYEVGCLLVRDVAHLERALRVLPEYLQDTAVAEDEVNFADRGVQLTRSFRALKIWLTVQTFGVDALRQEVGRGIELARRAEVWLRDADEIELLAPRGLGIVCFRFRPPGAEASEDDLEEANREIQDRLVRSGYAMISSTRLAGQYSLRLCVLGRRSRWDDVRTTLERIVEGGRAVRGERGW